MLLNLIFISIFPLALNASPATPRVVSDSSTAGIHWAKNISSGGCTADQQKIVLTAMDDAFQLAASAISALAAPSKNPAAYFFPPSTLTREAIRVLTTTQNALKAEPGQWYTNLNFIELYCEDIQNLCNTPAPGNAPGLTSPRLGYVPQESNSPPGLGGATIVVCPALLALPGIAQPCSGSPGLASLGWGFLRTVLALKSVAPGYTMGAAHTIYDLAPGLQQSHELLTKKEGYDQNVDNFAELATWSWDMGAQSDGSLQCPDECAKMGEGVTC